MIVGFKAATRNVIIFHLVLPVTVLVIMILGLREEIMLKAILNHTSCRSTNNNFIFLAFLFISVIPVQSILGFC